MSYPTAHQASPKNIQKSFADWLYGGAVATSAESAAYVRDGSGDLKTFKQWYTTAPAPRQKGTALDVNDNYDNLLLNQGSPLLVFDTPLPTRAEHMYGGELVLQRYTLGFFALFAKWLSVAERRFDVDLTIAHMAEATDLIGRLLGWAGSGFNLWDYSSGTPYAQDLGTVDFRVVSGPQPRQQAWRVDWVVELEVWRQADVFVPR